MGDVQILSYFITKIPGTVLPPELYFSVWDKIHHPEVESEA
jgi:hypothetical protein